MKQIINLFKLPPIEKVLQNNYENYQRELIRMEEVAAYSNSMVEYYKQNLQRLKTQMNKRA